MNSRPLVPMSMVVFDCDSTLSAVEGIDELAAEHRDAIAAMTDEAMRGVVTLESVYGRRLDLIRPARAQLDALGAQYVASLVDDARETVAALQAAGVDVRIMSGGLLPAVHAVAEELGIPADRVAAVDIVFDATGAYAGFDAVSPLARAFGKRDLLRAWHEDTTGPVMMVGDGITDLEAADAADLFVAYSGVAVRDAVVSAADVVIRSRSIAPVYTIAVRQPEAGARDLWDRGAALLDVDLQTALKQREHI